MIGWEMRRYIHDFRFGEIIFPYIHFLSGDVCHGLFIDLNHIRNHDN